MPIRTQGRALPVSLALPPLGTFHASNRSLVTDIYSQHGSVQALQGRLLLPVPRQHLRDHPHSLQWRAVRPLRRSRRFDLLERIVWLVLDLVSPARGVGSRLTSIQHELGTQPLLRPLLRGLPHYVIRSHFGSQECLRLLRSPHRDLFFGRCHGRSDLVCSSSSLSSHLTTCAALRRIESSSARATPHARCPRTRRPRTASSAAPPAPTR